MKIPFRLALAALASATLAGCLGSPSGPSCNTIRVDELRGDTVTTESGLRYIVAEEGEGEPILATQVATVHYIGFLPDGTFFDGTAQGQPATFDLRGNLIPGFVEGVTGMRVGEVRRLIIPPALAYRDQSPTPCVPPNSTLHFDVQLVGIGE